MLTVNSFSKFNIIKRYLLTAGKIVKVLSFSGLKKIQFIVR